MAKVIKRDEYGGDTPLELEADGKLYEMVDGERLVAAEGVLDFAVLQPHDLGHIGDLQVGGIPTPGVLVALTRAGLVMLHPDTKHLLDANWKQH